MDDSLRVRVPESSGACQHEFDGPGGSHQQLNPLSVCELCGDSVTAEDSGALECLRCHMAWRHSGCHCLCDSFLPPTTPHTGPQLSPPSHPQPPPSQRPVSPSATPPPDREGGQPDEGTHVWQKHHFRQLTFCNVCRALLIGVTKQGYRCSVCFFACHQGCAKSPALAPCRHTSTVPARPPQHCWVEGNVHFNPKGADPACIVCGEGGVGSITALRGWRCAWCFRSVHSECRPLADTAPCEPELRTLIAPPNRVRMGGEHGWTLTFPAHSTITTPPCPLLVFINAKSGGQQGKRVRHKMIRYLNPRQVYDLTQGGPGPGLDFVTEYGNNFRVLVGGGDGTANWVLEALRQRGLHPAVAILPLGTGNDLARSCGWGGGYTGESIRRILQKVAASNESTLDRWTVRTTLIAGGVRQQERQMNNYWSMGTDAAIGLDFHRRREAEPSLFNSRAGNYLWYARCGIAPFFTRTPNLSGLLRLTVDGRVVPLPKSCISIVVLNLASCYAGKNLWGNHLSAEDIAAGLKPIRMDDGLLEVVATHNMVELTQITAFMATPERVAQGSVIKIEWLPQAPAIPCQVDGEPYLQEPAQVVVSLLEQAKVLISPCVPSPTSQPAQDTREDGLGFNFALDHIEVVEVPNANNEEPDQESFVVLDNGRRRKDKTP